LGLIFAGNWSSIELITRILLLAVCSNGRHLLYYFKAKKKVLFCMFLSPTRGHSIVMHCSKNPTPKSSLKE